MALKRMPGDLLVQADRAKFAEYSHLLAEQRLEISLATFTGMIRTAVSTSGRCPASAGIVGICAASASAIGINESS